MIARNRVWEELKQAKANIICLQHYTDKGRKKLRRIDSAIIILASIGSFGGFYNKWIAIILSGLVAIGAVLKTILPNVTQSEQELSELDRLMDFYSKYMNRIERLWYMYDNGNTTEDEMIHKLFEMKEEECDKYSLINKGIRSISKKEQEKIDKECIEYINRVYFLKSEIDGKE
ncbi:MAG: hypothetical protein LBG15_09390 [Dysgonamonadaceae bacterium]|jgi:hypothetical protein|nr:hypothetical protein [Dysgonamonadaceae bacterium]